MGARERFLDKVMPEPMSGCWLWIGAFDPKTGYGHVRHDKKYKGAHRLSYELFVGEITEATIHHTCETRCCVNPAHLVPLSQSDNNYASAYKQRVSRCKKGHDMNNPDNVYWRGRSGSKRKYRQCLPCRRLWDAARQR